MMKKYPFLLIPAVLLSACSSDFIEEERKTESYEDRKYRGMGKAMGEDVFVFGGARKRNAEDGVLGVNSHLWRASLDVLSFMPITSADPFGGVILTDWYSPHGTDNERFKVNVYILDRQLRSDGIKVSIFRQVRQGQHWKDIPVDQEMMTNMENTILIRARGYHAKKS